MTMTQRMTMAEMQDRAPTRLREVVSKTVG